MERGDLVRVVRKLDGYDSDFGLVGRVLRTVPKQDGTGIGFAVAFSYNDDEPPSKVVDFVPAEGNYEWSEIRDCLDQVEIDGGHYSFSVRVFTPDKLKPLDLSNEKFWNIYRERHGRHNKKVRHEANNACNLMRTHREAEAARKAKQCHSINLLLSALDRPYGFRRATRLDINKYVELCRAAGKNMSEIADILFHMLFENREPHQIGDIMPACSCTKKE